MAKKLCIIGGGSAYIPGFIKAMLAHKDDFKGWTATLYDIDLDHLQLVGTLSQKMADAAGADIKFEAKADRLEAFAGSDYILTSFRQGGFEMRIHDEQIPLKYDVIGNETVGPGGFFYGMRTVVEVKGMIADFEKACPNAIILNYTNPTNIVTEALCRYSSMNIYGMCDQPPHDARFFAGLLGKSGAKIESKSIGLNHANFTVEFKLDGVDAMGELLAKGESLLDADGLSDDEKLQIRLMAATKLIPVKYNQFYYFPRHTVKREQSRGKCRAEVILEGLPEIFDHLREQAALDKPNVVKHRGTADFGDFAIDVLRAISGGTEIVAPLNVQNRGLIDDLPEGLVVEVPCKINGKGVFPIPMGRLPEEHAGLIKSLAHYQYLTAKAGWDGNADDGLAALMSNPLCRDLDVAKPMYRDMSRACAEFLPKRLVA